MRHTPTQLQEFYDAIIRGELGAHYNIAPASKVLALRDTPEGRIGDLMRWGLIPSWAKDLSSLPMLHNARGETVAEKPMFRNALRKRRCLVPASGFYEWKAVPGQRSKQPFYISFKDGTPMSFAGLWERTRMPDGTTLDTCTIITTEANAVLEPVHHRMPVLLGPEAWDTWLGPEPLEPQQLAALLKPFEPGNMQAWGVSHAVNKASNDNPALVEPIAS
jgi:putative SOS response-associated peptidase YedK